jgi:hypothetical protein
VRIATPRTLRATIRTTIRNAAIQVSCAAVLTLPFSIPSHAAEKSTAPQLIALAKSASPTLRDAITTTFDAKDLKEGTAWIGRGPDFFFAVESSAKPVLFIDDAPGPQMQQLASSNLWYAVGRIEQLGKLHSFHYVVDGQKFGGRSISPPSRPIPTSNLAFRPASSPTKSFTPAKSTTA